jgi:hypothetical protein
MKSIVACNNRRQQKLAGLQSNVYTVICSLHEGIMRHDMATAKYKQMLTVTLCIRISLYYSDCD